MPASFATVVSGYLSKKCPYTPFGTQGLQAGLCEQKGFPLEVHVLYRHGIRCHRRELDDEKYRIPSRHFLTKASNMQEFLGRPFFQTSSCVLHQRSYISPNKVMPQDHVVWQRHFEATARERNDAPMYSCSPLAVRSASSLLNWHTPRSLAKVCIFLLRRVLATRQGYGAGGEWSKQGFPVRLPSLLNFA